MMLHAPAKVNLFLRVLAREESGFHQLETLFAALRSARLEGTEIIGFYHSHPDGSITPSQRDRESVWIGCSHVIVSLTDGGCRAITSCQLPYARAPFQQEPILVSRSTHTGYKPRRYIMLRLS